MEIPVLVEPMGDNAFRATTGSLWGLEGKGSTRAQAVQKLREEIDGRLDAGAEVLELQIGDRPHPLAEFIGNLKDDPMLEEWKEAMAEYRRETEERLQAEDRRETEQRLQRE